MKPLFFLLIAACAPLAMAQGQTCSARSGEHVTPVIELYTSEGCSSCPPADRWLSSLPVEPAVVPLAFHVDYWDSLGWPDRFARPEFTRRQHEHGPAHHLGGPGHARGTREEGRRHRREHEREPR